MQRRIHFVLQEKRVNLVKVGYVKMNTSSREAVPMLWKFKKA
jgi:hypothetical protein